MYTSLIHSYIQNGRIQFAMGYCRGLPLPANGDPEGEDGETPEADPAREILATVGPDNAAKYLVASQVQKYVSFFFRV